jgi:hypothetical protein
MSDVTWQPVDNVDFPDFSDFFWFDLQFREDVLIVVDHGRGGQEAVLHLPQDLRLCRAMPSRYPEPDWDNAPEWAHWWAVEPDGIARWYAEQPSIEDAWWDEEPSSLFGHDGTVNLPLGCDWRMTLRKRPEVTK